MTPFYIYFVFNTLNGKYYIGQTTKTVESRWNQHLRDSKRISRNYHLYSSLNKYGLEFFEVRTLFICYDRDTLNEAEEYFISFFDATNPDKGYNATSGGRNPKYTESSIKKMGESKKGKKQTPEAIEKRVLKLRGQKRTPEQRERMGKSRRGTKFSPEHCEALSRVLTGRKISPEVRVNMSNAHKGTKKSEEWIEKFSEPQRGRPKSEEAKAAMRAGWARRKERLLAFDPGI